MTIEDQQEAMRQIAIVTWLAYISFVEQGFMPEQAMELTRFVLSQAMQNQTSVG